MNQQDCEQGPSLFEELVKFQRQHSISGNDDHIASVVSTQLSTPTGPLYSERSCDSGATRRQSAPLTSTTSRRPGRDSSNSPPIFGASLNHGSSRKQGVYRQPLSRDYFSRVEENSTVRSGSAFSSLASSAPFHPRRASAPSVCNSSTAVSDSEQLFELPHVERDEPLTADEILARRLHRELNVNTKTAATFISPEEVPATCHGVCNESANSTAAHGLDVGTDTQSLTAAVESSRELQEQEDLKVALFLSKQDLHLSRSGTAFDYLPLKNSKDEECQEDANCSFVTAANSSFHSCDDDDRDKSVLETSVLVFCQGCEECLRAPLDHSWVYCQKCGIISPAQGFTSTARRTDKV